MDLSTVGARIDFILREEKIKAAELARRINLSRAAVSQWINTGNVPTAENVFAVADETGYSPRWIATGKGPPKGVGTVLPLRIQLADDEYALLLVYQNLTPELREKLRAYANGLRDASGIPNNVVELKPRNGRPPDHGR